ncbi:MAG: NUDIX domain-containing protein [Candidatus Latescibacteria bacterium]|nr:NUDIX domain-containing protein [Candidatus Latescibacterota bacterium]
MDELLDIVDESDQTTGQTKSKKDIHRDGDYHRAAHMWIYNDLGEILFQLRSHTKDLYPGLWDITGGHVGAGETYLGAAVRELQEELGIAASPTDLELLFNQRDPVVQREFQQVFLLGYNGGIQTLRLQAEEVLDARFFTVQELRDQVADKDRRRIFCPVPKYYLNVINMIEQRL